MNADQRLPLQRLSGVGAAVGYTLQWNGTGWVPVAAVSGLAIVSTTAPSSPATGQLWYDPSATC